MRSLISHLRYTIRQLLKSPGFTITAVLILALGIGANTAIFSLVNGLILRPLPYPKANKLVQIFQPFQSHETSLLNYPDFAQYCAAQIARMVTCGAPQGTISIFPRFRPDESKFYSCQFACIHGLVAS
jgi:hypothetical protein